MQLNTDYGVPVVIRPGDQDWVSSPEGGVERWLLERDGGEVARATSLVRFAPGSRFSVHEHGGGEEFLVLAGTFSDESGDFPAGTYVRNPPGTRHAPHSTEGCTIFVKLRQFAPADRQGVVIDTTRADWLADPESGGERMELHRYCSERVALLRWPAGPLPEQCFPAGLEALVLAGAFAIAAGEVFPAGTWLRLPAGTRLRPDSGEGCVLYLKTGHFPV